MIDVEPLIARELDRLVPPPTSGRADWGDVVRRSGTRLTRRRRPFVIALAAVAAVLACAGTLAATFGGFDDWLRGKPGKPAPERAQERFRAANGRSWAAFPPETELRELIRTEKGGREFVLYGFRSGNSLCLKLAAEGDAFQPQECAPASAVANTDAPIVAVMPNFTFYDRASRPTAFASFGIAADGVDRVYAHATDGAHRAIVASNSYLVVETEPNTATHVLRLAARSASGRRVVVRITDFVGLGAAAAAEVPGPTRVQATIRRPKVGWSERGEKRGFPALGGVRFVKPDPLSDMAVGISGGYCLYALRPSGELSAQSCGGLFERDPVNALIGCDLCGEFMQVRGAAADGVRRVVLFLADGSRMRVPMRHNLFAARVGRTQFPIRIVGYDARDRVVSTRLWQLGHGRRVPPAAKRLRPVLTRGGPSGGRATLFLGRPAAGYECWRVAFSAGDPVEGCLDRRSPAHLRVVAIRRVGRDLFVVGEASRAVRRVELRFANGDKAVERAMRGKFVVAVPREHLSTTRRRAFVVTFDADGERRGRQRIFFRLR